MKYGFVIRRLLLIVPTLLLTSVVIFVVKSLVPYDSVEIRLEQMGITKMNSPDYHVEYNKLWIKSGKNLALFYFSIQPSHYADLSNSSDKDRNMYHSRLRVKGLSVNEIDELYHKDINVEGLDSIADLQINKHRFNVPSLFWHGKNNQYHQWVQHVLKGDLGISHLDGRTVTVKIKEAFSWTMILIISSLLIVLLVALPAALYSVYKVDSFFDRAYTFISILLYSIPMFWLGTIILVFFSNDEYGLKLFHSSQVLQGVDSSIGQKIYKLWPAIVCIVLGDLAYVSMMLRSNLLSSMGLEYYTTAISKGLSKWKALLRHLFPNTMIPIITLIAGSIPLALGGSLTVEVIFGIPGMGRLLFESIYGGDWPVVYGIVLIIAIATSICYFLADLLQGWLDPRINLNAL